MKATKPYQEVSFKQFAPADIYAGVKFEASPDGKIHHDIAHCVISNRPTGIEMLDQFAGLLLLHGHRYPQWYAKKLGLETAQFSYAVSALTGYSCPLFIDTYLLLMITDLLRLTDSPITAVARRAGFPRASELSQFLQRVCRRTPGALRSSLRK